MSNISRLMQITSRHAETTDIATFELRGRFGEPLPAFDAGAHIEIEVAPEMIRQYSLLNDPAETHRYVIGVLKDPTSRGGSIAIHQLRVGDIVNVAGPRNHFPLHTGGAPSLLLAGGIGITPLICMARTLHRERRPFRLHYCVRSLKQAAFLGELEASPFIKAVSLHCDDADEGQRLDLNATIARQAPETEIYICGPAGFMTWCIETASRAGFGQAQIHREYFKGETGKSDTDTAFDVKLASTGEIINIPSKSSILNVLRDAGVAVEASCETGVCGTCLTGVLSGTPEHRDVYLSAQERAANDAILLCCSRALSPLLVLDL